MSISLLQNATWMDIKVNNVVSVGEINGVDIIASNLQVDNMTVNEGFARGTMDNPFPQQGTANQVLTSNGAGLLSWSSIGGGGSGLQGINTNTPNDLSISEAGGIATINFTGSSGSTLNVVGTTNQIEANTISNTCTLSLPTQVSINTLDTQFISINNAYQLPTVDGQSSQVLSTNGSGTLSWTDQTGGGSNVSIQGTVNEVTVSEPTSNNYVISLPSTINTNSISTQNLNINNAYNMPTSIGLENQVLSVGSGNNLVWSSGSGSSGVNSITAGDNNIDISGTATNPTIGLANQITWPIPSTTNSFLIVPSTGASYAKIGTNALSEEGQSAQLLVSNEDRDVYGSLALDYNVSPELQNATLTLQNTNTVAGVSNSTTILSATGGLNLSHNGSTSTVNITAEQLDVVDSNNGNTTSIVSGTIWLASGNDQTALSGNGVVFHALSPNQYSMPPNKGTENQVIQMDNASAGTTKWATISSGGTNISSLTMYL